MMVRDVQAEVQQKLAQNKLVLFMKGMPAIPQCGCSGKVVQVLRALGYPFVGVNILLDEELKDAVKQFGKSDSFPQLYVDGKLYGDAEGVMQGFQAGKLAELLQQTFKGMDSMRHQTIQALTPVEAQKLLHSTPSARLLDVRTEEEWDRVHLPFSERIDQAKADAYVERLPKDTPLLFLCHHGRRSLVAAQFFVTHGFTCVYNINGGIDAWAMDLDPELKRY